LGVGAVTTHLNGTISFVGFTADGTQIISPATYLSEDLQWPFYGQLYGSTATVYKGSMWGWIDFAKQPPVVSGTLYWWKPAGATTGAFAAGFSNVLQVVGSAYTNFALGTPLLGWNGATTVSMYDGANFGITNSAWSTNNKVAITIPNTNNINLVIAPLNGLINGTFGTMLPRSSIRGVILQNSHEAVGSFITSSNAGTFLLQPH
jgi:hypothetical protein